MPKEDLVKQMAEIFEVSPRAITVPNIETSENLMHTLFALEDMYGLKVDKLSDEVCIRLRPTPGAEFPQLFDFFQAWYEKSKLHNKEKISDDEYDDWRYNFTDDGISSIKVDVPPDIF